MIRSPASTRTSWPRHEPSGASRGSRSTTAPGIPTTSTANRFSCACTRSRMNGIWFRWSFASVKQELQQVLVDELARRPGEDLDALLASAGVGEEDVAGPPPGRRPERRRSGTAQARRRAPPSRRAAASSKKRFGVSSQSRSSPFTLNTSTRRLAAPSPTIPRRRRQHPQEEQRERGLRGDPADAADRHVAALAPVEEVEVDVDRQLVAADPDRERPPHLVDVERLRALVADRALDRLAGVGGDPDLGVDPGHRDTGGAHLRAGHDPELGDPVRVGLERTRLRRRPRPR